MGLFKASGLKAFRVLKFRVLRFSLIKAQVMSELQQMHLVKFRV